MTDRACILRGIARFLRCRIGQCRSICWVRVITSKYVTNIYKYKRRFLVMNKVIRYKKPVKGIFHTDLTLCLHCEFVSDTAAWVKNNCCCPKCDHDALTAVAW